MIGQRADITGLQHRILLKSNNPNQAIIGGPFSHVAIVVRIVKILFEMANSIIRLPGLIDVHVHLREPGATHKEDFYTGSRAAIKGGFTCILDMPNNPMPTVSMERLEEKIELSRKAICDIGFHYGTDGKNIDTFEQAWQNSRVFGLKIYCNHTTGQMLIEDNYLLEEIFKNWNSDKPILLHAEGIQLALAIGLARIYNRRLHVCHISQESEVDWVRQAKKEGLKVTAGVTPHHLFLIDKDVKKLGPYAVMKPPLGADYDRDALWRGLQDGSIDLIETDHAPHTVEEKEKTPPPFGVPGLETCLPLIVTAVKAGKLRGEDIVRILHDNPKKIFNIPDQHDTYIEVNLDEKQVVGGSGYESKCGWTPFHGWQLWGKVEKVVFRGETVLENGQVTYSPNLSLNI